MQQQQGIQQAKQQRQEATGAENIITTRSIACALVRAAGASFTNAGARGQFANTGTNGVTRTSAGLYTLTLATACPSASTMLRPTCYAATGSAIDVQHTSDTVKTIRTFDAAEAAADLDFDLEVIQVL